MKKEHLITAALLAIFFAIALYFRIALPYDNIFVGDWIKFASNDAYYYMRLVDNLLHNYPHSINFDAFTFYPNGYYVGTPPFFAFFISSIAMIMGLGQPTQHIIDLVGVYIPPILGALTILPVYFIGKELFNRWAGVIAAGLLIILPGEFLGRSGLGFTDHHAAEVLLTTVAILFLILAVKSARQAQIHFSSFIIGNRKIFIKPLIYCVLAGIFLGIYLLTWAGGLLFVFIIFIYFIVQLIVNHLRGENVDYLVFISLVTFIIASILSLIFLPTHLKASFFVPSLFIAILIPLVLAVLSNLLKRYRLAVYTLPLILTFLGGTALAIMYLINPDMLNSMLAQFEIFNPGGAALTIYEAQPLLFPDNGVFSFALVWISFTTSFFLGIIALFLLIYLAFKSNEPERMALIIWSLVILSAALGQRRFVYYLTINIALLTGYFSWLLLRFAGLGKNNAGSEARSAKPVSKQKHRRQKQPTSSPGVVTISAMSIILFFLVFFPNIGQAVETSSRVYFAPSDAWCQALDWLRTNTPDPSEPSDFYYDIYKPPPEGERYLYPASAYGVMAWWDYGHWITRIAHRMPNSTPGVWGECGQFFSKEDEKEANIIMDRLNSKYVIVDRELATTKIHAVAELGDF
ncbi:oligosaccharyl transferase, archaeosortase A system-associated, partial [Chloroflexota bacterium]